MGYYINPKDGSTKEDWLEKFALSDLHLQLNGIPKWSEVPEDCLPVCLVDNQIFTAAAIVYDEREFDAFNDPDDFRPKNWFFVRNEFLAEFLPVRLGGTNEKL